MSKIKEISDKWSLLQDKMMDNAKSPDFKTLLALKKEANEFAALIVKITFDLEVEMRLKMKGEDNGN